MALKTSCGKKVLDIKSRWKKKSYHFENLFSVTCFLQKRPKKSPLFVENAWEQRMFTTMEKEP